jgi:heme/copper-type cytochrome/quinol oxidase subunit 3
MTVEPVARWDELPYDERRGTWSMGLFIATEAALFVVLLFGYFYLRAVNSQWTADAPPKMSMALAMLVVLLSSSGTVAAAEYLSKHGRLLAARLCIAMTLVLGCGFLSLQALEYAQHLRELEPSTDAYGSIFYTITSIHAFHVVLGLLMLGYAALVPNPDSKSRTPYRSLHNAAMYWHFVDVVWIVIVISLYLMAIAGVRS